MDKVDLLLEKLESYIPSPGVAFTVPIPRAVYVSALDELKALVNQQAETEAILLATIEQALAEAQP